VTAVAAVDIGSNSTRLLITDGRRALVRESIVTGLGEGVDATGRLGEVPIARVLAVLERFRGQIEAHGAQRAAAVMTSAVRDAANGAEFAARVSATLGFASRVLSGDDEARLTYAGATYGRPAGEYLVIDIGGGSTELVLGSGFHVSTQIGVVRHSERHLHADPPLASELRALADDVRKGLMAHVPVRAGEEPPRAIAVAGTPTQCAAIDLGLEPYDPGRVEGHVLTGERLRELLARVAAVPLAERRAIRGVDPARAPVLVAGIVILLEVVNHFGLDRVEVSERDILVGLALSTTSGN
jgi:exopolyphosphatase / guanosine-5'-triphosphate,3'-diphosphate pyrophosphatase